MHRQFYRIAIELDNKHSLLLLIGHCEHDSGQGCVCSVPGCGQLHADGQPGVEEAGVLVPDELRQVTARHGHHGSQYLRQGKSKGSFVFNTRGYYDCFYLLPDSISITIITNRVWIGQSIVEECGFLFVRYQMVSGHFDGIPTIPILFAHWMSVDHLIGN